ncbi:YceI family protein [Kibdelosporangium aridum]|uniref:Polyisoprenoid-binding protein YceI n=1 Tax=Kibdelosporangium aridum TaxID=2030 RepID=A0A1W2FXG0_KIBAR|nr:YceI family protein [Kibdelosporangium aridum]SMD26336.1 Polyisoprenoid-binding protein YceI [Kibdelosporangium aridum]
MQITIPTGRYTVDAAHSSVTFTTRFVIARVKGTFTDVSGTVEVAEDPAKSTVSAEIAVNSVHTAVEARDEHLRSADFFDVANHPTARFTSTELVPDGERYTLRGDLTIRGTTRPVEFDLYALGSGTDHTGAFRIGFRASTRVSRNAFGVNGNISAPGGPALIGDATDLTLEIQAILAS